MVNPRLSISCPVLNITNSFATSYIGLLCTLHVCAVRGLQTGLLNTQLQSILTGDSANTHVIATEAIGRLDRLAVVVTVSFVVQLELQLEKSC